RILESDILGIATMDCNDGNVKGFVGYKYPTYACCVGWVVGGKPQAGTRFWAVGDGVCGGAAHIAFAYIKP
ncbi:TPA: hypothetical protein ACJCRD_002147, partial [Neisseria meningitidis]